MLDKLKALFIVQEDKNEKISKKTESPHKKKLQKTLNNDSSFNNEIMNQLLKAINDNNQEGFDYIEFKNAVKSLESMKMDEKTRFQSAFATAQTLGVTTTKLKNSIGFYQKILLKQETEFMSSLSNSSPNLSLSEQKEINNLISINKKQIKQLATEIKELEKKIYGVSKNGHSKSDFEVTFNTLIREMRSDIKKINNYL